jgi:plastocyanin
VAVKAATLIWTLVAGALGAAVAVVPALALSEGSPTVEARSPYSWSPPETALKPGGSVAFKNENMGLHGIIWRSAVQPECSAEVPVGTGHFGSKWQGSCTFAQEGVYQFECSYHMSLMRGTVYVNATGTVPGAPPTTTSTSTPAPGVPPPSEPAGSGTASTQQPGAQTGAPAGTPLAGSPVVAVSVPALQRGHRVHGSITFVPKGAEGHLEIALLAHSAAVAAGRTGLTRVGRLLAASLPAGKVGFVIPLDARARRALRSRHRLSLTVRVVVRPAHGATVIDSHPVLLRG